MSIYGNSVGHPLPNPRKGMDMTGSINMNGHQLGGLAEPVKDSDATSKGYVDNAIKCILTKYTVTLFADGWADNLQKVAVDFATSSNTIFSSPDPAYYDLYTENGVIVTEQADGSVTFRCESVPDADIIVNLAIFNPLPISQKEPVAYLYNGVRLPKLPEWDKEMYPYAVIYLMTYSGKKIPCLHMTSAPLYCERIYSASSGAFLMYRGTASADGVYLYYKCDDELKNWGFVNSGTMIEGTHVCHTSGNEADSNDFLWANYDLSIEWLDTGYLPASDPIPVYE